MSNRTRNYIVAGLLLMMGLLMVRQQWIAHDRTARLDAGGVVTQGMTRDVRVDRYESVAVVEFAVGDEDARRRDVPVSRAFANRLLGEGRVREVSVRYLPDDPDVADIVGASEVSGLAIAFTLGLFVLAGWVFRRARRDED